MRSSKTALFIRQPRQSPSAWGFGVGLFALTNTVDRRRGDQGLMLNIRFTLQENIYTVDLAIITTLANGATRTKEHDVQHLEMLTPSKCNAATLCKPKITC